MAFASGNAEYKCFTCGTMHKWWKLMDSENPESFKKDEEWPDNVAVFRTDGTTETSSSGGIYVQSLYAAVETMNITDADGGSKRGTSGPGHAMAGSSSSATTPGDAGIERAHGGSKRRFSGPARGMLNMRVCRDCELQWREANKHTHPDDPEWATMKRVTHDHKKKPRVSSGKRGAGTTR